MSEELKPCPFCGCHEIDIIEGSWVECHDCRNGTEPLTSRGKAIASWNRRAEDNILLSYRKELFAAIAEALELDGHHKHYEGQIKLSYLIPGYFNDNEPGRFQLEVDCYVLGPERHYRYHGSSPSECVSKAKRDLTEWVEELRPLPEPYEEGDGNK